MTDPELARRVAAIGTRRAGRTGLRPTAPPAPAAGRPRRRQHPAAASRLLALGFSAAALIGLVTVFTVGAPASPATATPVPAVPAPVTAPAPSATAPPGRHVVIIIHRSAVAGGTPTGSGTSGGSVAPSGAGTRVPTAATPAPAPAPAPAPSPAPVTTSKPS